MSLIQPKRYLLPESSIVKDRQANFGENRQSKVQRDVLIYISIVDLIKNLLSNDEYKKLLEPEVRTEDNAFRSFMDGSIATENKLLKEHGKNCLKFILYFD